MSAGVQDRLHDFAVSLLQRRGALVEWSTADQVGSAMLPEDVAESLKAPGDMLRLACEPGGEGLCANLATDFLELTGGLLAAEPRTGTFRATQLYLKRKEIGEAASRAFTWLNVKAKIIEARATSVEYHTWWFRGSLVSEDRWETSFPISLNAVSGLEVEIPDPLQLWELEPGSGGSVSAAFTQDRATSAATRRLLRLGEPFLERMDARLSRDRKRLNDYYHALLKEAGAKKTRGNIQPDPERQEAKKLAVNLELRRKTSELQERYAIEATLAPIVLIRTELPVMAVDLSISRKRWQRKHVVYWNPLRKQFEPMGCGCCGVPIFAVAFTNETVEPRCATCAKDG